MKSLLYRILGLGIILGTITACSDDKTDDVDQTQLPQIQILSAPKVSAEGTVTIEAILNSDGGDAAIECSLCYSSTNKLPNLSDQTIQVVTPSEGVAFRVELTELDLLSNYYIRIYSHNRAGGVYSETAILQAARGVPSATTGTASEIGANSATLAGSLDDNLDDPTTVRGILIGEELPVNPETWTKYPAAETGLGSFTVSVDGLKPQTNYYYAAYGENSKGIGYGEAGSFLTLAGPPSIETLAASNITARMADITVTAFSDGGETPSIRGFCYGTTPDPIKEEKNYIELDPASPNFTGTLTFPSGNTTYYVRAYAENSKGVGYSPSISVKTLNDGVVLTETVSVGGKQYGLVRWAGYDIMTTNLALWNDNQLASGGDYSDEGQSIYCYDGENASYGCFYRYQQAVNACAEMASQTHDAWRLPTMTEWGNILNALETAFRGDPEGNYNGGLNVFDHNQPDFVTGTNSGKWNGHKAGTYSVAQSLNSPSGSGLDITVVGFMNRGKASESDIQSPGPTSTPPSSRTTARTMYWSSSAFSDSESWTREFRLYYETDGRLTSENRVNPIKFSKEYGFFARCIRSAR